MHSRRSALARPRLSDGVRRMARGFGLHGQSLCGVGYFLAGMVMLPLFPIGVLTGMVYGAVTGIFILLPGALLASILATVMGRTFLKEPVLRLVTPHPGWSAVCEALSQNGLRAVVLNRMAPVLPFGLQNYALGAVGVRMRDQFWGTLVGMQPALWVALYIGQTVSDVAQLGDALEGRMSTPQLVLLLVGCAAVCVLFVWLVRAAGRARDAQPDSRIVSSDHLPNCSTAMHGFRDCVKRPRPD